MKNIGPDDLYATQPPEFLAQLGRGPKGWGFTIFHFVGAKYQVRHVSAKSYRHWYLAREALRRLVRNPCIGSARLLLSPTTGAPDRCPTCEGLRPGCIPHPEWLCYARSVRRLCLALEKREFHLHYKPSVAGWQPASPAGTDDSLGAEV